MRNFSRLKNQLIAKFITRFPALSKGFVNSYTPWESKDIPWTPVKKPLNECTVAVVTTAGVHHKDQKPFDMNDPNGDPTFRIIDRTMLRADYMITHDYYDHSDAAKDINIVFPIQRLKELENDRYIGRLAKHHYSFMGHIDGLNIHKLIHTSAKNLVPKLKKDKVDVVLLTPG